ncbi:MAG: MBL fold metallo-hydrolase [Candidatus Aminicenantales bacterium]
MAEICFLGTGGSVATPERDNTSFIINFHGGARRKVPDSNVSRQKLILIDCPGSIIQKVKKLGFSPLEIGTILVTHIHPDHIYGLPSLVHSLMLEEGLIRLYGSEETIKFCRRFLDLFGLQEKRFKMRIGYVPITPGQTFSLESHAEVTALSVPHHSSSLAYHFRFCRNALKSLSPTVHPSAESPDSDAAGTLDLVYSGDTPVDTVLIDAAHSADCLIHDCSAPSRIFEEYPILYNMHTHSLALGRLAHKAGVRSLIPCHFFGEVAFSLTELEEEIRRSFNGKLIIPHDFDKIQL